MAVAQEVEAGLLTDSVSVVCVLPSVTASVVFAYADFIDYCDKCWATTKLIV